MLLSHHPPCDYDRTCSIGGVRLCVRCLGVALGAVGWLLLLPSTWQAHWLLAGLCAVPGVLDFTLHELNLLESSPAKRLITGLLFGFFLACLICAAVNQELMLAAAYLGWFFVLQVLSGLALSRGGRLEKLLGRYEAGISIDSTDPSRW